MSKVFVEAEVRNILREAIAQHKNVSAFARSAGVSGAYMHAVLKGLKPVGPTLLNHLNLERVTVYVERGESVKMDDKQQGA